MVRQLQEAQDVLSSVDHRVEFMPARLRLDELDELDLVELVLADQAARIAAGAASLGAEARRVAAVVLRQLAAVEDLIAVVVRRRHLSRRHEVVVETLEFEHVIGKLRQLARTRHARLVGDVRCEHLRVAVLVGVQVHHEVDAGALEAGAESLVEREARARDLGSAVGVEDVELRAEIPVRLRLEVELRRLPPLADLRVLRVVLADWHVFARHVRDVEHDVAELGLDVLELLVELRDLGADGAHLEDLRLGIFLVLLHDTDLLRDRVALALERLRLLQEIAALLVETFKIIEVQRVAAVLEHLTDFVEMFAHKFDIQQCSHTPL